MQFLINPDLFPGISMSTVRVTVAEARAIVEYLDPRMLYQNVTAGASVVTSVFDVYYRADRSALYYVKAPCGPTDTQARFFLHAVPVDVEALPDHRRQYGFDNLDFDWRGDSDNFNGTCFAAAALPDYAIASIRTGQYIPDEGRIWTAEFRID